MMKKNSSFFIFCILLMVTARIICPPTPITQKNRIIYLHEQHVRSINDSALSDFIKNNKNVILIFYEDWCGPCKRMTPIFEEIVQKIDNVLFIKVKRSLYKELFAQFGLTTIPAMIFFKNGVIVHTRPQSATEKELMALIKTFFN